jgi:thymidylate synthase (FAD)
MGDGPAGRESFARASVPALDAILGSPFQVLDEGFVRVIDYMGDDAAIVQAARVSYGKGTKRVQKDRALIRYLLRNAHTTPFEMCEIKLHVRVPMDVWRQWIRHRTASVNEYSTRYSEAIDAAQRTPPGKWRLQSASNRQGSGGFIPEDEGERLTAEEGELHRRLREIYAARIAAGVAREQARKDLPLATYTEAYWKIDLHNLLHFLELRMDAHAQQEIREYAVTIGKEIVARWVPVAWEAFGDYRRSAMRLSRLDAAVVAALAAGDSAKANQVAGEAGLLARTEDGRLTPNRERGELDMKLAALGLTPPWS